jgi:EmrB/QacA subfamily drug resistance transporter
VRSARASDASPQTRVMVVAVLASMVAFLDGTVVNLALPAIGEGLGGGLALQQWVVDSYLLAMGALILPGGSISDLFGRIPVLRFGLVAFGLGSMLAALAPSALVLITGRSVQGMGAAFLVPGSLALINSSFKRDQQPVAIGSWTAWTGTSFALGPLLGGLTVDVLDWRWIFILSAAPMAVAFALTFWLCPDARPCPHARVDLPGAILVAVGLTATVYGLIEQQRLGIGSPTVAASLLVGVVGLALFVRSQHQSDHPMVPMQLFRVRNYRIGNLATAFVYGGLTMGSLVVALFTQEIGGYTATQAGLATLPIPLLSFLFARHVGERSSRIGPRVFLAAGPIIAGAGILLIRPAQGAFSIWSQLLPGMVVLAAGLVMTVTPLTSTVLAAVDPERSGIASAINNATSRLASLLAVASTGIVAEGALTFGSFFRLMAVAGGLLVAGGLVAAFGIRNPDHPPHPVRPEVAAYCRDRLTAPPHI